MAPPVKPRVVWGAAAAAAPAQGAYAVPEVAASSTTIASFGLQRCQRAAEACREHRGDRLAGLRPGYASDRPSRHALRRPERDRRRQVERGAGTSSLGASRDVSILDTRRGSSRLSAGRDSRRTRLAIARAGEDEPQGRTCQRIVAPARGSRAGAGKSGQVPRPRSMPRRRMSPIHDVGSGRLRSETVSRRAAWSCRRPQRRALRAGARPCLRRPSGASAFDRRLDSALVQCGGPSCRSAGAAVAGRLAPLGIDREDQGGDLPGERPSGGSRLRWRRHPWRSDSALFDRAWTQPTRTEPAPAMSDVRGASAARCQLA